jgi:hypothetical protein
MVTNRQEPSDVRGAVKKWLTLKPGESLLTLKEAASRLGISLRLAEAWRAGGKFKVVRFPVGRGGKSTKPKHLLRVVASGGVPMVAL